MLEDPNRDSDMMRRQMTALVIMLGMAWVWLTFFAPKSTNPPVPAEQTQSAQTPAETQADTQATNTDIVYSQPATPVEGETAADSLPPVAEQTDPASDEVMIQDGDLRLVFTKIGARLKRADVILGENGADTIQLVPEPEEGQTDVNAIYPLGLRFTDRELGDELDYRRFTSQVDPGGRRATFSLTIPNLATITKRIHISEDRHVVDIDIGYQNLSSQKRALGQDLIPAYILNWGPGMVVQNEGRVFPPQFVWRHADETEVFKPKDLPERNDAPDDKRIPGIGWIGYKSKYFLAALKPAGDGAIEDGWVRGTADHFRFGLYEPAFELQPGASHESHYRLYVGPMQMDSLREAWPTLSTSMRFFGPGGWFGVAVSDGMDWFAKLLLRNLNWWHGFIPSYGIAIILMTVLVRMVMFPLMIKQIRSMKQMQALQPEMQAMREKYADNPQELNKAMMEFYRERKINPLAGCFPLFLQMPVFIALYRMVWNAFELRGAKFLYIQDLSQPDRFLELPFMQGVPLIGNFLSHIHLIPILAALAMVVSMRLTPTSGGIQNPQQKKMMNFMPIIFMSFSYSFSAGINLYILTSTVLGIIQNQVVRATDIAGPALTHIPASGDGGDGGDKKSKPVKSAAPAPRRKKPQHFYDRARQRKKEMARADKKRPKRK